MGQVVDKGERLTGYLYGHDFGMPNTSVKAARFRVRSFQGKIVEGLRRADMHSKRVGGIFTIWRDVIVVSSWQEEPEVIGDNRNGFHRRIQHVETCVALGFSTYTLIKQNQTSRETIEKSA